MTNYLETARKSIAGIENTIALVALSCIPVVGTVVQVIKEQALLSSIRNSSNQQRSLLLLKEKNRITTIFSVGLAVQAIAILAIAIFAGAGFYALGALIPFALVIGYNISKIKYNNQSIEDLRAGSIFVPRVR